MMADFVKSKKFACDIIVAVPPTRTRRVQPLFRICDGLGAKLKLPVLRNAVKKSGASELKNLHKFEERSQALENAISVDTKTVAGRRVLLVDDLVRSGAMIKAVAEQLKLAGASAVYVIAVTQTRRR